MLIIVESPTKAKKISSLLGLKCMATVGHYQDLPLDTMGVDLKTYEPHFVVVDKKKSLPDELRAAARGKTVYIASDADREGGAIAVHVYDAIGKVAKQCFRMLFFEVTEKALKESMAKAVPFEKINPGEYNAFLGRRVGDRLVGYILSPIASKDLHCKISVGRVQSPGVRLIVDREREIRNFKSTPFWILAIQLNKNDTSFLAHHLGGKFEQISDAQAIVTAIKGQKTALAEKVDKRETKQNPKPPFTTVDLQASAAVRLKFAPDVTMALAQSLFQSGLISYHRTDSFRLDADFITEIRTFVGKTLGPSYLPAKPNEHKSGKSQIEGGAHEAIRPTHMHSSTEIAALIAKEGLTPQHAQLYELIFRRAVASQLAPALYDSTSYVFDVSGEKFKASGRVLKFEGFLKVYTETAEESGKKEEEVQTLPAVAIGEHVPKEKEILEEKKTKAPGRFSLGSLVKELERLEVGRPSTYASICKVILDRGYVKEEKGKVVPLPLGETLIDYLAAKHQWVIDYDLTSRMEGFLDTVATNAETYQRFCKGLHAKMGYMEPPARGEGSAPTEPQLRYANSLAEKGSLTVPAEALVNSQVLSKWIESIVGKKDPAKGSASKSGKPSHNGGADPGGEEIGACPSCGKPVKEFDKEYSCTAKCGFNLWKNKLDRFGKDITPSLAKRLIKGGPVTLRSLVSAKDPKKPFDANGTIHNDSQFGWSIKLSFDVEKKGTNSGPAKGSGGQKQQPQRQGHNGSW